MTRPYMSFDPADPRDLPKPETLEVAAGLLEEVGWIKHAMGSRELGGYCLLGAIGEAADGVPVRGYRLMERWWIRIVMPDGRVLMPDFFNDSRTSSASVVRVLRDAAKRLREQGR